MTETGVAHRTIGQQGFGFSQRERPRSTLDQIAVLIEWEPIATLLGRLYPATKGEPAWPPLAMFRAMLLAVWYDLSDVKLADALEDRASFRLFCGFSGTDATPERTAFVRFRRLLVAHDLDRALFDAVTTQLVAKAITVKAGTIVNATIVASASEDDGDGRWVKHRGKRDAWLQSACRLRRGHRTGRADRGHAGQRQRWPCRPGRTARLSRRGLRRQRLSRTALRRRRPRQGRHAAYRTQRHVGP